MNKEASENTFEEVRSYFENPNGTNPSELSTLAPIVINILSQIYSTAGNIDRLNETYKAWLEEYLHSPNPTIESVTAYILSKEFDTRRVDEKFFAQIRPQGNKIGIISNLISSYLNSNTVMEGGSPVENRLEAEVLGWMANMVGYDKEQFSGNIETGGTAANITALWVARQWAIKQLKDKNAYRSRMPLYFIAFGIKHYSIVKACKMLGINYVETNSKNLKTDPASIEEMIKKMRTKNRTVIGILGVAGATETGLVDNIQDLSEIASKYNIHFHVDAAYGGPFLLSKESYRFEGINLADSITIDPHKMLYTPFGAGIILFKDRNKHSLIIESMAKHSGYLESAKKRDDAIRMGKQRSFGYSRITGSMSASGVISTWATINLIGKSGFAVLLDHQIDLTNYAYNRCLDSPFITPLFKPETNTLLFKLTSTDHLDIQSQMQIYSHVASTLFKKYGYMVSIDDEILGGYPVLRFVAMHPFSSHKNVEELISYIEDIITNRE